MRCVRIWFNKVGMSRYISHLDLMRTMTRAVRRSKIPLWYTEGFNPHPYMTFSLPLSLGMESVCESMDIKIEGEITNEEIFSSLKAVMPEGIEITAVTEPVLDPKFIAFGRFDIRFYGMEDPQRFKEAVCDMLGGTELIVQKLGKKGRKKVYKDINLLQYIKSAEVKINGEEVLLTVVLPAGSAINVNPSLLADEIKKREGDGIGYVTVRKNLLTEKMEDFR